MKKQFIKICKNALDLQAKTKENTNFTEEDLDILAEAIDVLNSIYEELYDKVFVNTKSVCKGTPDQL